MQADTQMQGNDCQQGQLAGGPNSLNRSFANVIASNQARVAYTQP